MVGRAPGGAAPATLPDEDVLERVLAGERDLFALLVRRYQDPFFRYALGMVGDNDVAADLVQDCFIRAYSVLSRCRDRRHFRTWLFRIVRNRCLDYLKEKRRKDVPLEGNEGRATSPDEPATNLARAELAGALRHALDQLPEAQREAFLLKHVDQRSYEEMSELLGSSVSALKMRVLRAREALRELLAEFEAGIAV